MKDNGRVIKSLLVRYEFLNQQILLDVRVMRRRTMMYYVSESWPSLRLTGATDGLSLMAQAHITCKCN